MLLKSIFFILLLSPLSLFANIEIAYGFLHHINSNKSIKNCEEIVTDSKEIGTICHLVEDGYILLNKNRNLSPIKAYSLTQNFLKAPEAFREALLKELLNLTKSQEIITRVFVKNPSWDYLEKLSKQNLKNRSYAKATKLLKTNWGQGYPFNLHLPYFNGKKSVAGCVNIALAQIMNYYSSPVYARGGYSSYMWNNENLKRVFNHKYHWNLIGVGGEQNSTQISKSLVASLIKDLAVLNKTELRSQSDGGSGAKINISGFIDFFNYSNKISFISSKDSNFFELIKGQIDNQKVVLLTLPSHAGVVDGYVEDVVGKQVHINMGWDGIGDNYYYIDEIVSTPYYSFDPIFGAYINFYPCQEESKDCPKDEEEVMTLGKIEGVFDYLYDIDKFSLFLDGESEIVGSRGFANQAFFITIIDKDGDIVVSKSSKIEHNFQKGWYTLITSLCDGGCYSYTNERKNYTITYTPPLSFPDTEIYSKPIISLDGDTIFLKPNSPKTIFLDIRDVLDTNPTIEIFNSSMSLKTSLESNFLTLESNLTNKNEEIYVLATNEKRISNIKKIEVITTSFELDSGDEFTIDGEFSSKDSINSHKVVLDGNCTIKGENGFANQAFFIKLSSDDGILFEFTKEPIAEVLKPKLYTIKSSLKDYNGSYFELSDSTKSYNINIKCENYGLNSEKLLKVLNPTLKVDAKEGWNLLGNPQKDSFKLTNIKNSISNWTFKSNSWIINPSEVLPCSGFWSFLEDNETIEFEDTKCTTDSLENRWNLISFKERLENPKEYFDAEVVWIYEDNSWIENPETISVGIGFWVKR